MTIGGRGCLFSPLAGFGERLFSCHSCYPFTFDNLGLRFLAAAEAALVRAANMAPARSLLTPERLAIFSWTALNPG